MASFSSLPESEPSRPDQAQVVKRAVAAMPAPEADLAPAPSQNSAEAQARELHKIQELTGSLAFAMRSFTNLNQVLELIPVITSRLTNTDGAALVLVSPHDPSQVEYLHCFNMGECQGLRRRLEQPAAEFPMVIPIVEPSAQESLALAAREANHYLTAHFRQDVGPQAQIFNIPILLKPEQSIRGWIYVHTQAATWEPDQQHWLRYVADQAAVALENRDLTNQLRDKALLEKEVASGSEVQSGLQPSECPEIEGLSLAARAERANQVGGDYYDFIAVPQAEPADVPFFSRPTRHWSIVIADVMGKGVPAGLLMAETLGTLRNEVLSNYSPARILHHLNQQMFRDLERSRRFISLFYSQYCPETRRLAYSNAAHNPPFWWQAATRTTTPLDTEGMLLGVEFDSHYEEASVQLAPGDVVVYYTDGFTEALNHRGDRLETEGLIAVIEQAIATHTDAEGIMQTIFEAVKHFGQGIAPQHLAHDDMTLVVLKVLPDGSLETSD